jgi:hypothetical protein
MNSFILLIYLAGVDYPVVTIPYETKEICEEKATNINTNNSSFTAHCHKIGSN